MSSQRIDELAAMTGPGNPGFGAVRLAEKAGRSGRVAYGPVRRADRSPEALLVRPIAFDPSRTTRVQPHAVASAVQFADWLVTLAAGALSFAMQSTIASLPAVLWGITAGLVLALMARKARAGVARSPDLLRRRFFERFVDGAIHALAAFGFALVVCVAVLQPDSAYRIPLVNWVLNWALIALVGIMCVRLVQSVLLARWRADGRLRQPVAVYGTGDLAERLVQRLSACPDTVEIVGVFDDRTGRGGAGAKLSEQPRGTTADLVELSRQSQIDRVIVALPHAAEKRLLEILRKLHKMPVEISLAPDMVGFNVVGKDQEAFGGLPLLDVYGQPLTYGQCLVKTVFDRLAAGIGLILLSPVMFAVAVAIRLDSPGPALFRQNRYGFGDRVIEVYKFRTMRADVADPNGASQTEVDDPRLTRIGGFLRRWSLDELPQLFNVLRGELSLVGPRPHAVSMRVRQRRNEDIVPDYALRHHVKPGITGWAQVNGYHGPVVTERALHERVAYDIDYIKHWSLWFDIRILLKTLVIAFGKRHAY